MQPGVQTPPPASAAQPASERPQVPDIKRNLDEGVFGGTLFQGRFAAESFTGFNPNYRIAPGDWLDVQLWGAVNTVHRLEVDPQGRLFLPRVGPVKVSGVRAEDLSGVIAGKVERVYRENVSVYATLVAAEPVKVFVTGAVQAPGLYGAFAADSLLHYLDRAGGIQPRKGSYLDIRVIRAGKPVGRFSIYDFLLEGRLPLFQFRDGDTVVVGDKLQTATVNGLVLRSGLFEFRDKITLRSLLELAVAEPRATHVQVIRHNTDMREAAYLDLSKPDALATIIHPGDEVLVLEDRQVQQIVAKVEGEYAGISQFVLPYASNLADLMVTVQTTPLSDLNGAQLYRRSIAERQREVLDQMLQKLEQAVLSARSGTREEAELRTREADLIMRFIDRAKNIEPQGQLVLQAGYDPEAIFLEDKDRLRIPRVSNTVAVQGEVFFPSAFVHEPGMRVAEYLQRAGGISHNGSEDNIFLRRPNGEMVQVREGLFRRVSVRPGDEILVLPKVDSKRFQFSKDLVQIIYQIALSAGVVLRI